MLQIQKNQNFPPEQYEQQLKIITQKKMLTRYDKSQTYVNILFHQII